MRVLLFSNDGNLYRFTASGTALPKIPVSPAHPNQFIVPQVAIGRDGASTSPAPTTPSTC